MFNRVPFKREHLEEMLKQDINTDAKEFFSTVDYDRLETQDSFTGILNGKPMVCGGAVFRWRGSGFLWTVFDENSKTCFIPVFRGVKRLLADLLTVYNRLEVAIPFDFEKGIKRAKLLGFKIECERAEKFLPDGKDCCVMSLIGGS